MNIELRDLLTIISIAVLCGGLGMQVKSLTQSVGKMDAILRNGMNKKLATIEQIVKDLPCRSKMVCVREDD